ncbi:Pre-mRNA-splicing factor 38 [Hyphodiscus hymeniophilus]|uniref:Pre-mRNA-splicing factor 38 n=1 Tax=Hyphodiscus hymeniophilus TaxID=353542 RepID=A0A9P6VMC1_9HELO|nr:Pre-mRNA-splicing factor 38 [Hyphodiscus hymeniophilus]
MANHRADEKRFLDERGSGGPLAPNGLNPATIMEKPVRERIIDSYFWKDQCFGVNEADIINRVVEQVHFVGGTYGDAQKPSPFLCLAFKLLQLGPADDVAKDVYAFLEPYLEDRRKLKRRTRMGTSLTFMDDFVDNLLTKERVCGTTLWKMPSRTMLEDLEVLEPRVSPLGDIEDLLDSDPEEVDGVTESPGSEFGEVTPEMDELENDEQDKEHRNGD